VDDRSRANVQADEGVVVAEDPARPEHDDDGGLVITDYKTGKVPGLAQEQARLGGVHFYAFLCEQVLGRRPARIQLLYLSEPLAIVAEPTDQSIRGLQQRTTAIWSAVERACERAAARRPQRPRLHSPPSPEGDCRRCTAV